MQFQTEVWEQYYASRKKAKRLLQMGARKSVAATLPLLETVLDVKNVDKEVEVGVVTIPISQIVGLASARDRDCYAGDFLPLPSAKSEFAENWTRLYMEHLSDQGLRDPICCYEYFGQFYVIDGKKRVSVLKINGMSTVQATVIRILPAKSDDLKTRCYYEFLQTFEKTRLYQIAFSGTGRADAFLRAIGYDPNHIWSESDRYSFLFTWHSFEHAVKNALGDSLNITTADAVSVLLQKYTYSGLRKMYPWTLTRLMGEAWFDLYQISNISNAVVQKAS